MPRTEEMPEPCPGVGGAGSGKDSKEGRHQASTAVLAAFCPKTQGARPCQGRKLS